MLSGRGWGKTHPLFVLSEQKQSRSAISNPRTVDALMDVEANETLFKKIRPISNLHGLG
jgi:hypothetical protein